MYESLEKKLPRILTARGSLASNLSKSAPLPSLWYSLCPISVTEGLETLAEEKGDSSAGQWAGEP